MPSAWGLLCHATSTTRAEAGAAAAPRATRQSPPSGIDFNHFCVDVECICIQFRHRSSQDDAAAVIDRPDRERMAAKASLATLVGFLALYNCVCTTSAARVDLGAALTGEKQNECWSIRLHTRRGRGMGGEAL